ncbi:Nramp family divalent metal transporter [Aestuariibaculum suncheonense]|uniref:Nramp family divalent metal transporter n=1 Tax=Aestuariibaculum suncheonense TaxID=1028745 RepID=A0A8J6QEA3_9FLAO|nr:Nramp family divalent metal transporter [Aestuariibaculum suncheonense]MBD0835398.1 Nramp family divalent metal transporter [Aestuariibaculum suncheonense]
MFDKIKKVIKSLGPGIIIASVVLGPGSIAVASRIGSEVGYSFLWVIIPASLSMIIYVSMAVRFGITNSQSILHAIAQTYGRWFSVLIGVSAFISAACFQFGNNLGIGIGMEGITGIDERVWPVVFTFSAIILLFWAKNLYKALEKLMMILVMIMILAFFINILVVKPDVEQVAKGFLPISLNAKNLNIVAALIATTFALNGAIYQSYLVQDKGWKISNLNRALNDSYMGIFFLALISILIIITSAAALYPIGVTVNSAADMALQLEALFGNYAMIVFSFGLCAAAFSSLMVNAVIGGGLLSDGLGLGRSMNERIPKILTTIILVLGMLIAVFFQGNVIYALIVAQATTLVVVPLIAVGMYLILNNKQIMGNFRNSTWQNILAMLSFILISIIIYYLYSNFISFLSTT